MSAKTYQRLLQGGIIASLLIVFFVFEDLLFPYITSKQLSFNILMEVMLAVWLVYLWRYPEERPKKSYLTITLGVYFLAVLASIAVSVDRNLSFWGDAERMMGFFHLLHFFIFFLILITVFRTYAQWRLLLASSVAVAVAVSLYGLFSGTIYSTIGNTAYVSGYLIFNLFFAAILFYCSRSAWKWLYLPAVIIMLLEFAKMRTSGAIIGLGASLIFLFFLLGILHHDRRRRQLALGLAVAAVIGVAVLFSQQKSDWFQNSFLRNLTFQKATFQTRLISWRGAVADFPRHWLFGTGFGNYAIIFDRQFTADFYDYSTTETYFDRAHNNLIDIASTTGLVGLLSYLSIFVAAVYYLARRFRERAQTAGGQGNFELLLLSALLAAYFIQNLAVFDSFVTYIGLMLTLGYLYWLSQPDEEAGEAEAPRWSLGPDGELIALIIALAISLLVAYQYNYKPWQMFKGVIRGYAAIIEGRLTAGMVAYEGALKDTHLDRDGRSTLINLLTANPNLLQSVSSNQAEAILDYAIMMAEKNVAYNPLDSISQLQLAQILDTAARYYYTDLQAFNYYSSRAMQAVEYALMSSPNRPPVHIVKAQMQLARGESTEALATLQTAIDLNPRYYEGYCRLSQFYFFLDRLDEKRGQGYYDKIKEPLDRCLDLNGARDLYSADLLSDALAFYVKQSDVEHALVVANRLVEINGYDAKAWLALSDLYRAVGKNEEAEQALQKAKAIDPEAVSAWQSKRDKQ